MKTDPAGRMFITYRRSPGREIGNEEARLMRDAMRDRGVPTWRDLDDLTPEPTEDALVETLSRPDIAGAVMLISPEIEGSDMVRMVEAPAIFDRHANKDGFLVKPVLINLDYGDADRVLGRAGALQDIGRFDIDRIDADRLIGTDARRIAKAVLKSRLAALRPSSSPEAYSVGVFSRRTPGAGAFDLRHDFTPYFTERAASEGAYDLIEAALFDTAAALAAAGARIPLIARGNAALPVGVLYGSIYSPFVFDLTWKQFLPGKPEEDWSLAAGDSEIDIEVQSTSGALISEDIVVAVSVNADVDRAVAEYFEHSGLDPRATISIGLKGGPLKPGQSISPADGLAIALRAVEEARALKDQKRLKRANIHLFLSCPLALAVLIGQKLNTFAECALYEHIPDGTPAYAQVHRFKPSGFSYSTV